MSELTVKSPINLVADFFDGATTSISLYTFSVWSEEVLPQKHPAQLRWSDEIKEMIDPEALDKVFLPNGVTHTSHDFGTCDSLVAQKMIFFLRNRKDFMLVTRNVSDKPHEAHGFSDQSYLIEKEVFLSKRV